MNMNTMHTDNKYEYTPAPYTKTEAKQFATSQFTLGYRPDLKQSSVAREKYSDRGPSFVLREWAGVGVRQ